MLSSAVATSDFYAATDIQRELNTLLEQLRGDPKMIPASMLKEALDDAVEREQYEAAAAIQAEMAQACELAASPSSSFRAIWSISNEHPD